MEDSNCFKKTFFKTRRIIHTLSALIRVGIQSGNCYPTQRLIETYIYICFAPALHHAICACYTCPSCI